VGLNVEVGCTGTDGNEARGEAYGLPLELEADMDTRRLFIGRTDDAPAPLSGTFRGMPKDVDCSA
jgi:hypothetical protein